MPEPISSAVGVQLLTPPVIAGVVGSIVSLRFASHLNWWERLTAVISGAMMAQYCAPVAAYLLRLHEYQDAVGFFIGLFGLSLTAALYEAIKKADLWALAVSRLGGREGK